jgi:hypothetical protein
MKLYRFDAERTLETEGYIIAPDKDAAEIDAKELADPSERDIWEDVWGVTVTVSEITDTSKLPKGAYIWAGGPAGDEVTQQRALEILAEIQPGERPPECPGQLSIEDAP